MLYSCARSSDIARVVEVVVDRVQCAEGEMPTDGIAGFIALHTKGARSQVHKRTLYLWSHRWPQFQVGNGGTIFCRPERPLDFRLRCFGMSFDAQV